jgi:CelD/BcsL family acetyltransferase involved in cellulose biosynthesis
VIVSLSVRGRAGEPELVTSDSAGGGSSARPNSSGPRTGERSLLRDGITLVPATCPAEWDHLVDQPGGTLYHRWDWLSWIAPLLACRFVPLMVLRGGRQVGVAPMLIRSRWGLASANIVPFPYLGPVVPVELVTATAHALLRWARRHRVMSTELCLHPDTLAADDALAAAGLEEERAETFLIDLDGYSETELFARLGGDARTAVRRSAKRGVFVRAATADDLREVLPAVHNESLVEDNPHARVLGEALAEGSLPFDARCATAVVGDRPVGLSITLGEGSTAVGWLGAVHRADQATQANAALVWDAITWAAGAGYATLDMCGAPDPGIAVYKRKFRPRTETYLVGRWQAPTLAAVRRLGRSG